MFHNITNKNPTSCRRGSVYVAVLGVALIVGVIGITSIHVARMETRRSQAVDEMARARLAARSGVECVLAKLKADLLWRQTYGSGVTSVISGLTNGLLGNQSFDFTLVDSDGDLDDNPEDAVTIRCVGSSGDARHVVEVLLQPSGEGLSCLSASLHSSGNIRVDGTLGTNQVVSSNSNINATGGGAALNGNAQAVGTVSGNVTGTRTNGMSPALEMPDQSNVFEYYLSNGTEITYSQVGGKIVKTVLSPTNNPYGSRVTNQQGIYVINCQGNKVSIEDSRILGTLVFVNVGPDIEIEKSVHWEPAIANFPAMLVQGSVKMKWQQQNGLNESTIGVNFNPGHTPYQGGADSDMNDTYPGSITGLVYILGSLDVEQHASIDGVTVIQGDLRVRNSMSLLYKSNFLNDAPPGFGAGTEIEVVPGTWKQVAY